MNLNRAKFITLVITAILLIVANLVKANENVEPVRGNSSQETPGIYFR